MPLIRYEVRNEFSLADPELYRAADKDDPEALLEGVAMAGLIGVLRQLGDLAEFAADIFHNLHEEVMATAARGHSLMVRVQQLETEVPSIERAFLSQTDHSSFFYTEGINWRSNLRLDENLVTQEDLPRFVMDSYEECREPPRLFLLDKFDVAGAGACLKRYTDPSFFKVETSRMSSSDVQREKKILKPKKKGSRWRNGETPETIPTSSTKLHQLLSVERAELGVSNTSRRVKLKRKLNGFPFDLKTGKSYMEKLLKSSSPDHKLLHEVNETALPSLMLARSCQNESGLEALEVRSVNSDRESVGGKRSPPRADREEVVLNPSIYDRTTVCADDNMSTVPNSDYCFARNSGSSSTLDKVPSEKVIAVDAESRREGRLTGYESDGISSDVENYVDAPLTMESDTDTEPKLRMKGEFAPPLTKGQQLLSDGNKAHISYRSSDSRSTGDSLMSDEKKEISSFTCSDSPSTSSENPHLVKSANGFPSVNNPEIESASLFQKSDGKVFPVDRYSKPVVCYSTHTRTNSTNSRTSDSEQPASRLCRNESISSSSYSDPGVVTKYMVRQPGADETASTLDEIEKVANMVRDTPCHPCLSDSEVHHEDESDRKDGNLVENRPSRSNKFTAHSRRTTGTRQLGSSKNLITGKSNDEFPMLHQDGTGKSNDEFPKLHEDGTGKSNDEFPKLHEELPSGYPCVAHRRDNITPMVPQKENMIQKPGNEDSYFSVKVSDNFSGKMEESLVKNLDATSSPHPQTADSDRSCTSNSTENQNSSENLILSHQAKSPDCFWPGLDANEEDIIPEQETKVHETLAVGPSRSFDAVEFCGTEVVDNVPPSDTKALESSCHMLERSDEPAGESDPLVVDEIILSASSKGKEVPDFCDSEDQTSLNEAHVECNDSDSKGEKSSTIGVVSNELAVPKNAVAGDTHSELIEENTLCPEDSGLDELDKNNNCLTGVHGVDGSVDKGIKTFGMLGNQLDHQLLPYSGEVSPKSNHEDHKGARDSAFTSMLVDLSNSQSVSKPIMPSNGDITGPQDHKDSLGSKFMSCSLMSEANQVNLVDLPPLPPLPPMPWRTGKLQRASSYTEFELKKLELLPQLVSPITTSTDSVSSSLDETPHSSVKTVTKAGSEKEVDGNRGANLESKDDHETVGVLSEIKSKQLLIMPTQSESTPLAEEDETAHESSTEELPHPCHPLAKDVTALDNSEPREGAEQVWPELQTSDKTDSLSEQMRLKDIHDTIDLPTKIESKQQQFVMPTLESESLSPAEDGVGHESCTQELPQSGTSLAEDAILDKSQPRNVLERGGPQAREVDEKDSLSEEISTENKNEIIDHPPITNSAQQLLVLPTPESETTPPADKDGVAYGIHTEKLPGACSSPIEDAAAFHKSQPREVTEQDQSQILNQDENKISEQIQTNNTHELTDLPPKMEGKHQQFIILTPVSESTSQSEDSEAAHCSCTGKHFLTHNLLVEDKSVIDKSKVSTGKHFLPHNPLVEDKSVLDKSKLKKVSERVIPEVPKLDDKNSFLEQIRTKSFNLKRTTTTSSSLRPSILSRVPTTNVKVAAILEKANAIRQAMAGSDEDDDDSWSDS